MHSIIQSCLSEYTFPLEDEFLTQGKAADDTSSEQLSNSRQQA